MRKGLNLVLAIVIALIFFSSAKAQYLIPEGKQTDFQEAILVGVFAPNIFKEVQEKSVVSMPIYYVQKGHYSGPYLRLDINSFDSISAAIKWVGNHMEETNIPFLKMDNFLFIQLVENGSIVQMKVKR